MTVVGLDDTDSREAGMCTTYVASQIADRLAEHGHVERLVLVRCNPAVEYKTRGNAALAIHTDCEPATALELGTAVLDELAITADEATNPGLVVADHALERERSSGRAEIPGAVTNFALAAIRDHLSIAEAGALIDEQGYRSVHRGDGRGRIGALAAIGAWHALDDWTYERIAYRERSRWGTPRAVEAASVLAAADDAYPRVWDTVDRGSDELVCVPHTPGPVLFGIRGDDPDAVDAVADAIESEPVAASRRFVTNQGTDVHLRKGRLGALADGRAYRVDGVVADGPETRRGGHVFVPIVDADGEHRTPCVAFEPTKRFRDRVRALRPGDHLTVCGERSRGTIKLEKFAVRELRRYERVTPTCPECQRTMESAGRGQGYRCRSCGTERPDRERVAMERALEPGWYEVPPRARRHVAKPLVRGGFDAPTHPER